MVSLSYEICVPSTHKGCDFLLHINGFKPRGERHKLKPPVEKQYMSVVFGRHIHLRGQLDVEEQLYCKHVINHTHPFFLDLHLRVVIFMHLIPPPSLNKF
jgi:hypothetical protein